ncbi:MAG: AAA family ATPase [Thermoanaerobaculaceae bacterium]|nr:AAA family ATPase [Thermoanaerobaculaceae bacterium]MDI9622139.1 AAA family ATPase [Acidobacteriota bacterium]NLH11842.1 AAA family ATPase [Holophagae bacterium]HPW56137.1 AAA family ATPase [Thermoanaerobaculaceae bacterium]
MILESVQITNFLSIVDETLRLEDLTVLVGSNGSGKSAFLRAVDYFFLGSPKISDEDFHARDTQKDIAVTLTFTGLSDEAKLDFQKYVNDERFSVTRVFSLGNPEISGKYFGSTLQHAAFKAIRGASGKEKTNAYKALRDQAAYSELPAVSRQDQVEPALIAWEEAHPDECTRSRDSGQFLGYTGVGQGSLRRHIRFVLVPAVREAAKETEEGRSSPISELLDLVVRSRMAVHAELEALRQETQGKLKELVSPSESPDLDHLGGALSQTLQQYATDTAIRLQWQDLADLAFPQPKALVKLREHDFECTVDRAGHGLQRALIVTLLQHLEAERHKGQAKAVDADPGDDSDGGGATPAADTPLPGLLIAIEEPELYQHPNRQRQISSVLLRLAKGEIPGVAGRTQILYSTHSPLLVSLDRMDQVRRVSRAASDTGVKQTLVRAASLNSVAAELWELSGKPGAKWHADSLRPRLEGILNPWMNEGFFSELVVLVEGESDRAALLAHAATKGHDLEAMGVSVIPCDGKASMDRPALIFRKLGVPTYIVWDNDQNRQDARPDVNRLLCRILGRAEEDYPTFVEARGACIQGNLEQLLEAELAGYAERLQAACAAQGLTTREGRKKPGVVRAILTECSAQGSESATLGAIVEAIVVKRRRSVT